MRNRAFFLELRIWFRLTPNALKSWRVTSLPSIERFRLFGWESFLFNAGAQAARGNDVLILGGYHGESAARWLEMGARTVTVFEPIPLFVDALRKRFEMDKRVCIIPSAASDHFGEIELGLSEDGTSSRRMQEEQSRVTVPAINFDTWVQESQQVFGLAEVNIEGAEYDIFRAISDESLSKLRQIHIQFHQVGPETENLKAEAENRLLSSHIPIMDFDMVWSIWSPR